LKKCIFLLLVFFILSPSSDLKAASDESIEGTVIDAETGEPVGSVNVFLSGTTLGCSSLENGGFRIEKIPRGSYDCLFQRLGYKTGILRVDLLDSIEQRYQVSLTPQIIQGESVQVTTAQPKDWRKNLSLFEKEFIGKTGNAGRCKIMNPEVLSFSRDKDTGVLSASSDSILHIENQALGYFMDIIIKYFTTKDFKTSYTIYLFFREIPSSDATVLQRWEKNRLRLYRGSFRHFLSALARGRLKEENFQVTDGMSDFQNSETEMFLSNSRLDEVKCIHSRPYWRILSLDRPRQERQYSTDYHDYYDVSVVKVTSSNALIDTLGNCLTRDAFTVQGSWAKERIADQLPRDYFPKKINRKELSRRF
jgi:hypothetical protein